MTTDDPSEVRPGDVRTFTGLVDMHDESEACWVVTFGTQGRLQSRFIYRETVAASTLIRRARPEIKVGDTVGVPNEPSWVGDVDALSADGRRAYLRNMRARPEYIVSASTPSAGPHDISDLTPVEDNADG
ncbi:hypothetical protein [Amorphus sp. MBR-141]